MWWILKTLSWLKWAGLSQSNWLTVRRRESTFTRTCRWYSNKDQTWPQSHFGTLKKRILRRGVFVYWGWKRLLVKAVKDFPRYTPENFIVWQVGKSTMKMYSLLRNCIFLAVVTPITPQKAGKFRIENFLTVVLNPGAVIPQLPTPSWMFWRLKPNSSDVVVQDLGCCIFFRGVFVFLVRLAGGSTTLAAGSTTLAVSKCLVNLFPPKELFPDLFLGLNYSPLVFPQEFFENSTLI